MPAFQQTPMRTTRKVIFAKARVLCPLLFGSCDKALGVTIILVWMCGCQQNESLPPLKPMAAATPEDHFNRFVERLEHALAMGKPSPTAGIRVEHSLRHHLHAPQQPDQSYTAEVVIETITEDTLSAGKGPQSIDIMAPDTSISSALKAIGITSSTPKPDDTPPRSGSMAVELPSKLSNSGAEGGADADPQFRPDHSGQLAAKSQNASLKEERAYELAYRDNRWHLITELEYETERLWFQYALQN
jgi:hypothetical protein